MSFNRFLEKTISKSQHCQRNWDLSRQIPIEDIKTMKTSVTQCGSKQNRVFYKCKFITNRDMIEKIHSKTDGFITSFKTKESITNSQTLANLVVAFIRDRDPSENNRTYEDWRDGRSTTSSGKDESIALGIAAGYLTLTANMLGYSTGCCQCFDDNSINELLGDKTLLLMGIGYPDPKRSRLEHHVTGQRFPSFQKNILVDDII